MAEEVTLSSQLIYDGRAVRLRVDTVRTPGGGETTREIVEHSDCVAVIPLDAEDNVLLVNQFRKPVEKKLLEIPAGGIEPGEDAEATVRRELREEIGYLPRKIERLGGFYSAPGYGTEYLHLYLATDLVSSPIGIVSVACFASFVAGAVDSTLSSILSNDRTTGALAHRRQR